MDATRESKVIGRGGRVLRPGLWVLGFAGLLLIGGGCQQQSSETTPKAGTTALQTPTAQADREPKDLEAKVTIVMGEALPHMYFASAEGAQGGSFTLPAGKTVGIRVINSGKLGHEIAFGQGFDSAKGDYAKNLFGSQTVDLFVFKPVKLEAEGATFGEIEVEPGGDFWIRTKFPTELKGEWELGCFVEGHYDAGMKAKLIIE